MTAPPVLTAERIDAMLSVMAEVCLDSVVESGQRQKAADDFEAFERSGRALQRACRNLRQTIALKQRFDREQVRKGDDARRAAEATRLEAQREQRTAVDRHHGRVRRHFERVLWDEYEDGEAQELFEDVDDRLSDLAEEADFLEIPAETLIQRLADEIGLGEEEGDKPKSARRAKASARSTPAAISPEARAPAPSPSAPPATLPPAPAAREPPDPPDPPNPPEPPAPSLCPAPPPEPPPPQPAPYLPPWERLRPGERAPPGGTGW